MAKGRRKVIEIWNEIKMLRKKLKIVWIQIFNFKFNFKFQIIKAVSQRESNPRKGFYCRTNGRGIVYMKKKWDAEWQAELLRLEEEMAKARARVKIYENKNQDQEMVFKIEENKQDNTTYHQQTAKHSEINQHSDQKNVQIQIVYRSIPWENYDQKLQHAFREVMELVKPFVHDNPKYGYKNGMKLLVRQYGNPFKLLACYRNKIKQMAKIKPGDATAFKVTHAMFINQLQV